MFSHRAAAGTLLAEKLSSYPPDTIVLGLARGGVAVAAAAAKVGNHAFDCLVVKKIASPFDPELGIGAVAPDDISVINWPLAHRNGVDEAYVNSVVRNQELVVSQKMQEYRRGRDPLRVKGKTVALVDDGAATGATMEAAVAWAKKKGAARIVVALPVASREVIQNLTPEVHEVIALHVPDSLESVGKWYTDFAQVDDAEVIRLLAEKGGV